MEQERKLAHIEKIEWIKPIEGADRIVTYGILGWEVVDQKDKYKVGTFVCYCEVDSVLPEKPEYEFLKDRKYRVRTIKLKGQVSQGLILPLPQEILVKTRGYLTDDLLGKDITELIGITKYLSPFEREELEQTERKLANEKNKLKKFMMRYSWFRKLFLPKKQKSGFPYWVSKTDEPRCISGNSILNTDKGNLTIKEICESVDSFKVKSYNINTNTIEYKEIVDKSIKSNNNDWYEIELEDSTKVILTSEHPVYLPELNCYRQVKDLKSNDLVLLDK
jgi:RNA ligase (TIGR02306 family)